MKQVVPLRVEEGISRSGSYVLMLCEVQSQRLIPVIVGAAEAQAILLAKEGVRTHRPMTHETMSNVMNEFGIRLTRVTIDRMAEGIFYSSLHLTDGHADTVVDSRTTDAVALALLADAPIYVDDAVLDECSIAQEPDTDAAPTIEQLEEQLRLCEEAEDYEQAAVIMERIETIRQQQK